MIIIALSANLPSRFGAPPETFSHTLSYLSQNDVNFVQGSSLWLTSPVPYPDQPWYHNGVMQVQTILSPHDLLRTLKETETYAGREESFRNASRVLDLDILVYNDAFVDDGKLCIPHPRMHERAFVLEPLREMCPDWQHPALAQHIDQLMPHVPEDQKAKRLHIKISDLAAGDISAA